MRTDPTDTGGLFVGRRPGTAPVRFRTIPKRGTAARRRLDGSLATALFAAMVFFSLLCWGPIPLACLWVGSQMDYVSGSVFLGIIVAFLALFPMLFGTLVILRAVDHAWILARRAAGNDQRTGVMGRIFGTVAFVCALAFAFWFLVIHGPGSQISPGHGENPGLPG
jgi:hypothetical protein